MYLLQSLNIIYTRTYNLNEIDVLVLPKRVVPRYSMLSVEEISDLTISAKLITDMLKKEYPHAQDNIIWLIQDGKEAGQTVFHVHLHIIPQQFSVLKGIDSVDRPSRSYEEMKVEAEKFRSKIIQHF
ncbi:HIT-like domain-containing protein [Mycotypha africana]|uniref:HIT-like domain-containing protein n=1 Tax=Mycotypha africana TaxID=64632 RepID=UPI0022FFECE7|nr:HIT-like domain-containing protein [Mycotypha africana]KAI8991860.1 HIT-like domain-containing protein [Mycotypha africana]